MIEARKHWVRVESNRALGAYETSGALAADLPDPVWPELSLEELLHIAFRDHIIDTVDHIILNEVAWRGMKVSDLPFEEVWALDTEFSATPGERQKALCLGGGRFVLVASLDCGQTSFVR